ncbi:MAG: endolytic transglycosylase MltG [Rikenellaceae bacterium]|jgi:UPF0755 protein|nr:endolytic transglycosylase MltG [Rikenellaceae bacterium]
MKKRIKIAVGAFLALAILGVGAAAGLYFSVKSNAVQTPGEVYLPPGSTYNDLLDSLSAGEVKFVNISRFDRIAHYLNADQSVRPGHYAVTAGMDYLRLVRTFQRGWQTPVRVTFNNVRTLPQLAGKIAPQIATDSVTLAQAFLRDTLPAHYGFRPEELIGMFIPNTYEMYWTVTPEEFLDRMKREYDRFWTAERDSLCARTGLSRNEVITLASIVNEETQKTDEMPRVAGVYVNRLRRGMPLQADPTVKFAVNDFTLRRILFRHLEVDSPYNTYKYAGLPPGPIAMPSVRAIDAVLNYENHDYYYFSAREDFSGYHNFSRTLTEHNRAAARYHAALNRLGVR